MQFKKGRRAYEGEEEGRGKAMESSSLLRKEKKRQEEGGREEGTP